MRKKLVRLLGMIIVLGLLMIPVNYSYGAGSISLSGIPSNAKIGDTFTVTVSIPEGHMAGIIVEYDKTILSYVSCSVESTGGQGDVHLGIYNGTSATITFKTIAEGESNIRAYLNDNIGCSNAEGEEVSLAEVSVKITVKNEASSSVDPGKSADNSLQSLKVSPGTLTPQFHPSTWNYTMTVDYSVTSIVVDAKPSSSKATLESVTGNENLQVGENTISIAIVAENGTRHVYKIVVTRMPQDANVGDGDEGNEGNDGGDEENDENQTPTVKFSYGGRELSVNTNIPEEMTPLGFASSTKVISGAAVPVLEFENGKLTLVYLTDAEKHGALYVYDETEKDVYPFLSIKSENHYVIILRPTVETVVEGYRQCTLSIEGKGTMIAFQKDLAENKGDEFYVLYCMNDAGELGLYSYDMVEGTYQRFFAEIKDGSEGNGITADELAAMNAELKYNQQRMQWLIYGLAAAVAVLLVALIVVTVLGMRNTKIADADEMDEMEKLNRDITAYAKMEPEETEMPVEAKEVEEVQEVTEIKAGKEIKEIQEDDFDIEISINDVFPDEEFNFDIEDLEIIDLKEEDSKQ